MKRFALIAVLALSLAPCLMAQVAYIDLPSPAAKDTAWTRTRITRTIDFLRFGNRQYGATDLDIYANVVAVTDTVTVLVYPFKFKQLTSGVWVTETYADSTVLGTMALTTTLKLFTFSVDQSFSSYPIIDGFVEVLKKNGTDVDHDTFYSSARVTPLN